MSGGRLGAVAHGLRHLRRAPDMAALRALLADFVTKLEPYRRPTTRPATTRAQ